MVLNGKADESEVNSALELVDSGKGISCPGIPRVVSVVSSVLERAIQKNESLLQASKKKDVVTIFQGSRVPSLSIRQYIERIFKYSSCSPSCFVVAYIYIDRFLQQLNAYLTSVNAHRLLITSIMIAAKFIDDECYNNAYFAKIGGVSTAEMNRLEISFLFTLEFRLHVTAEVFRKFCLLLEKGAAEYENMSPTQSEKGWPNKDEN
ncbi:cyclin-P3-1-like [Mangifera indica]|uniref:cyclin-P3-1-like n=1 Tax=Mangifera indica TaxID=29780 RepID=UPI001CFBF9AD|nr:cyclin-P3-1-like [Mangifera indica]